MKFTRFLALCLVGAMAASGAVAADDTDAPKKAQHGKMTGADSVPDRAHKDDGAKYGDRDQDRQAGKAQGSTNSPAEGETGGKGTHTRGDGAGGGVNPGTGNDGHSGHAGDSGNGHGDGSGAGNGGGQGNRG